MVDLPLTKIVHGDCLQVLKTFPDSCIDLVATDPPYGYSLAEWDKSVPCVEVWVESLLSGYNQNRVNWLQVSGKSIR